MLQVVALLHQTAFPEVAALLEILFQPLKLRVYDRFSHMLVALLQNKLLRDTFPLVIHNRHLLL